jgi:hypothetical protein
MRIELDRDARIEKVDEHNWALYQRSTVQSGKAAGKDRWGPFGWYSSLEGACRALLEIRAFRSPSFHTSIESAVRELQSLWSEICQEASLSVYEPVGGGSTGRDEVSALGSDQRLQGGARASAIRRTV